MVYGISYKTFVGPKPSHIRFDKRDEFIKIYDRIRYVVLFDCKRYNAIYDRIRYVISEKSGITDSINHNFARIKIDSYNSLSIEKILIFQNVIILIKSVVNKNENEYYYNKFSEKGSCNYKSDT